MTYKKFKSLLAGMLVGDNIPPTDPEVMLSLVEMALDEIATQADSMHLLTQNRFGAVSRLGVGSYVYRTPETPMDDDSELDLDHELCFPLARLTASYISKENKAYHHSEASRLTKMYNSKVRELLESIKLNNTGTGYET